MKSFQVAVIFCACLLTTNANLFNMLFGASQTAHTPMYGDQFVHSMASQVPGSHQNTISGGPTHVNSHVPVPQVLTNGIQPPPGAATAGSFMNMINPHQMSPAQGHGGHGGQGQGQGMGIFPVTGKLKIMVNKWATQLGHKAYYEAHGCVDPTTALHGKHGQMANMAMMLGCNNHQAKEVCEMAQMAHGGQKGARMRMIMEMMMPKETKHMMEQCLSPSSLMNGMMGGFGAMVGMGQQQNGPTPPHGAATAGHGTADCSGVSQMLMMGQGAAEGMMSGESMEQIGVLRNRYLQMECQENLLMGSLPYRLCCPGHVRPPTMQEAMMMKSVRGGA